MIYGGEHFEWPSSITTEEIERRLTKVFDKEYEEYLWEQAIKQGPYEDDDTVFLKIMSYNVGLDTAAAIVKDPGVDAVGLRKTSLERLMAL